MKDDIPFSVVLAAGGTGTRMQANKPKQYLLLKNKPLALYSFEFFARLPEVQELVVVCDPAYQALFHSFPTHAQLSFAEPGQRRQDSVFNGIQKLKGNPLVCVHDAARPLLQTAIVRSVAAAANEWGAAVVGVPVKGTLKICNAERFILSTPDRSQMWEMQTPQMAQLDLLKQGYQKAQEENLTVTDDVSLIELLGKPVKVIEGSYTNIKVTTPEDLIIVEYLMDKYALL